MNDKSISPITPLYKPFIEIIISFNLTVRNNINEKNILEYALVKGFVLSSNILDVTNFFL